jgi:hypothetical protein
MINRTAPSIESSCMLGEFQPGATTGRHGENALVRFARLFDGSICDVMPKCRRNTLGKRRVVRDVGIGACFDAAVHMGTYLRSVI